jgi:hypothetical protein
MKARLFVLFLSLLAAATAGAQSPCDGSADHTAFLQSQIDSQAVVNLAPQTWCVNGNVGLNIPSGRTINFPGSTIALNPGCARAGFVCRIFNTIPGSTDITIDGWYTGAIVGDPSPACQTCWSILIRGDSVTGFTLRRLSMRDTRSDFVWLGGNTKSRWVVIDEVVAENAGRNIISAVNAEGIVVMRSVLNGTPPLADPGMCIDFEPNPTCPTCPQDSIDQVAILWTRLEGCSTGVGIQKAGGAQGRGYVLAWNLFLDNRKMGLAMNGVIGAAVFQNTIKSPAWPGGPTPGMTAVPLAGTIAGNTAATASTGVVFAGNAIVGQVYRPGEPQQVVTGDFRLAGSKNGTLVDNVITWGKFTQAALGVLGDDAKLRNELR